MGKIRKVGHEPLIPCEPRKLNIKGLSKEEAERFEKSLRRREMTTPEEKKSLNRALIVYIFLLVLLFAILPIKIMPEAAKVIIWEISFVGLIMRAIYIVIRMGKYDSQNRFGLTEGEEDIVRTWKNLPPGADMYVKRAK